jgi:hypothetical protein
LNQASGDEFDVFHRLCVILGDNMPG